MPRFTSADLGKSAIKGTEMNIRNEGIITGISEDGWVRLTRNTYKFARPKSEWVHEKEVILFTQEDKIVNNHTKDNLESKVDTLLMFFIILTTFVIVFFVGMIAWCVEYEYHFNKLEERYSNINVSQNESYVPTATDEIAKE